MRQGLRLPLWAIGQATTEIGRGSAEGEKGSEPELTVLFYGDIGPAIYC